MAGKRLIPKGCIVHSIALEAKGAEVRYRCADDRGQKEYRSPDGSIGNYPSRFVRGVFGVRLGSASISGFGAKVHAFATCVRNGREIECKPTTAGSFGGHRRGK